MKAVADSAPLIYLAKIGRLELLTAYYEVFIPEAVYEEVVEKGTAKRFPDALIIRKEIKNKRIRLKKLDDKQRKEAQELRRFANIGAGEAEATVLAKVLSSDLILDDVLAQGVAGTFGLKPLWTTSFILKLLGEGKISKEETKRVIEDLVGAGYWIGEDVLVKLLKKLE